MADFFSSKVLIFLFFAGVSVHGQGCNNMVPQQPDGSGGYKDIPCPTEQNKAFTYPNKDDCIQYYECWNGCVSEQFCDAHFGYCFRYDDVNGWCDNRTNIDCGTRKWDRGEQCGVTGGTGCGDMVPNQPDGSGGFHDIPCPTTPKDTSIVFPDKDHCSKYYECWNGCVSSLTCTNNNLFQPEKTNSQTGLPGICVSPTQACCGTRSCDGISCTGICNCYNDKHDCNPDNDYHHEAAGACESYFCSCDLGFPDTILCPGGLYYNEQTDICDWDYNNPGCSTK